MSDPSSPVRRPRSPRPSPAPQTHSVTACWQDRQGRIWVTVRGDARRHRIAAPVDDGAAVRLVDGQAVPAAAATALAFASSLGGGRP